MTEFELISRYFHRSYRCQSERAGVFGAYGAGQIATQQNPAAGDDQELGIGDDCALLKALAPQHLLAVSSDMLVEGRHFFAGTSAAAIGHKALAVNVSDLAAMGAQPLGFTLALALPRVDEVWLESFSNGLLAVADRYGCPLIGGDTTRGALCLAVTVLGCVPRGQALRRDGAQVGDDIWVSGPLGGAAYAVAARRRGGTPSGASARRLDWPLPRLALGLALRGLAGAAIDVSDGLVGDLDHILVASSRRCGQALGADLDAAAIPLDSALAAANSVVAAAVSEVGGTAMAATAGAGGGDGVSHNPLGAGSGDGVSRNPLGLGSDDVMALVLHGGDDYELLFTAPPRVRARVADLATGDGIDPSPPIRIGTIVSRPGICLLSPNAAPRTVVARGFDHFAATDS